jgi:DNA-binding CsgD family transcriptional regulator
MIVESMAAEVRAAQLEASMQRPLEIERSTPARRELIAILCLIFLTWYLAELSNRFVDQFGLLSFVVALMLLGVSLRLWSNLQRERGLRLQAEELLHARRGTAIPDPDAHGAAAAAARSILTKRECEVLSLIASSCSNQQIAEALNISLNTVERHSANVYRKLGIRGRVEATAYALRSGIVTEESIERCRGLKGGH